VLPGLGLPCSLAKLYRCVLWTPVIIRVFDLMTGGSGSRLTLGTFVSHHTRGEGLKLHSHNAIRQWSLETYWSYKNILGRRESKYAILCVACNQCTPSDARIAGDCELRRYNVTVGF
jgi:hypothetical protein